MTPCALSRTKRKIHIIDKLFALYQRYCAQENQKKNVFVGIPRLNNDQRNQALGMFMFMAGHTVHDVSIYIGCTKRKIRRLVTANWQRQGSSSQRYTSPNHDASRSVHDVINASASTFHANHDDGRHYGISA